MKKDIIISEGGGFTLYSSIPLIADDVMAYRIVFRAEQSLGETTFQVTAIRPDGVRISDVGSVEGNTGYYTIKNNMYAQPGQTIFRLTFLSPDGSVLTSKELICTVLEGNGLPGLSGDDRVPALSSMLLQASDSTISARQAAQQAVAVAEDLQARLLAGELTGPKGDTGLQGLQGIPGIAGNRSATIKIAAHNASEQSKAAADYVCSGEIDGVGIGNPVGDEAIIMQAISDLGVIGGCIEFSEGTFLLGGSLIIPNIPLLIKGQGNATKFESEVGGRFYLNGCVQGTVLQDMQIHSETGAIYLEGCGNVVFRNMKAYGQYEGIYSIASDIVIDSCHLSSSYDYDNYMYLALTQTNGTALISNSVIETMGLTLTEGLYPQSPMGIVYSCMTGCMVYFLIKRYNENTYFTIPYTNNCWIANEESL